MRTSRAPLLFMILFGIWVGYSSVRAATTWMSYPVDDSEMVISRPISYDTAEKCIEEFGLAAEGSFSRLCGRGCLRESGKLPNRYLCLEESLNGGPVTKGNGGYLSLIVHSAFPFLYRK